jgi:hypothetical protein
MNLLLQLTLLSSQLHVCRYEEASSMWPDLLQPTSDRIDDDDDVDVVAVTVAASVRAGACVRHELRCFACGQVSRQTISVFWFTLFYKFSSSLAMSLSLDIARRIVRIWTS